MMFHSKATCTHDITDKIRWGCFLYIQKDSSCECRREFILAYYEWELWGNNSERRIQKYKVKNAGLSKCG